MMPRTRADAMAIASLAVLIAAVITTNIMQKRSAAPAEDRPEPTISVSEASATVSEASAATTGALSPESPAEISATGPAGIFARYQKSLIKPAHDRVVMQYMPPILRNVLDRAAEHFSAPVLVTSAYRSPPYNRRVRGARNSMHMVRDGKRGAVDFKVVGVSKNVLHAWAKRQPEVAGIGLYCNSDFIHVDNGSKRSWYWGCGGRTRVAKGSRRIRVAAAQAQTID